MKFFKTIKLFLFVFIGNLALADVSSAADSEQRFSIVRKNDSAYLKDNLNKRLYNIGSDGTVDTYSLLKKGDIYYLFMESSDSSKLTKQLTFTKDFDHISILELSTEIDFYAKQPYLYGSYCYSDLEHGKVKLLQETEDTLDYWFFNNSCNKTSNYYSKSDSDSDYKIIDDDLLFDIKDSNNKKITLIALGFYSDEEYPGYPDAIACIKNCQNLPNTNYYSGKIGPYKITMYIKEDNKKIQGYYYYNKYKNRIHIEGFKENNRIHLKTKDSEHNETFAGTIEDGIFYGEWENKYNEKSTQLEFKLYLYAYLHFE